MSADVDGDINWSYLYLRVYIGNYVSLCVCVCIFLLLIFLAHLEHFSQSWSYYVHVINDHLACWPDWSPTNIIPLSVCLRAFLEKSNWRGNATLNIGGTTPWNKMKETLWAQLSGSSLPADPEWSFSYHTCLSWWTVSLLNGAHMNSSLLELHLLGIARSNDESNWYSTTS